MLFRSVGTVAERPESYTGAAKLNYGPKALAGASVVRAQFVGQDDPGGSGIASYNVYVSDNGGPFTLWRLETTATSDTYAGVVGHTYGLDHQDEDFNNADLLDACGRGSCMDYSADPTNNTTPNQHDYDELVIIYSHSDGAAPQFATNPAGDAGVDLDGPSAWGQAIRFANGRGVLYERLVGPDQKVFTWVTWAE